MKLLTILSNVILAATLVACGDSSTASSDDSNNSGSASRDSKTNDSKTSDTSKSGSKDDSGRGSKSDSDDYSDNGSYNNSDDDDDYTVGCGKKWNWNIPKEDYLVPIYVYGTMTDPRDGKTYQTIELDDAVWMAENLNYSDSVASPELVGNSWCYNDKESYCNVTGRLYTWEAAVGSGNANTDEGSSNCKGNIACAAQGICPSGWHIPSAYEYIELMRLDDYGNVVGKRMASANGWNGWECLGGGETRCGFSALPAGYHDASGFYSAGEFAGFWLDFSDFINGNRGRAIILSSDPETNRKSSFEKENGLSVRCVKTRPRDW